VPVELIGGWFFESYHFRYHFSHHSELGGAGRVVSHSAIDEQHRDPVGSVRQWVSAETLSVSAAISGETTLMATPVPSSNPAVVVALGQMWACQW
jgi:hypothetical protein